MIELLTRRLLLAAILVLSGTATAAELPLLTPATGKAWFVSAAGDNKNAGTREAPFKNIDKAIKQAKDGDTVLVAAGTYSGTFGVGYLQCDKALKLYGGFSSDFSARDPVANPTLFQPDNASGGKARKALLTFTKKVDGVVVDGFVFDMGQRNAYSPKEGQPPGVETGRLLKSTERPANGNSTVEESCIDIPSAAPAGTLVIRNNVFANCASFALQGGIRGGTYQIVNNVFVANRMAAVEIFGTCAGSSAKNPKKCGTVEIAHNTILFSWSRLKDFLDMGYGVRVMTKAGYDIHHNIFGGNIMAGVDHSRFNKNEWITLDHNLFFANKGADLEFSPASNTKLQLTAAQFGDLELASVKENQSEIPAGFPVDKAYLEGLLAARYSEKADYDENSPANQFRAAMGLNKQGKLTTKVSMHGNRYPWKKSLELFGAAKDVGAQRPQ